MKKTALFLATVIIAGTVAWKGSELKDTFYSVLATAQAADTIGSDETETEMSKSQTSAGSILNTLKENFSARHYTSAEAEAEALKTMDAITLFAGRDYEQFKSFYVDADDELIETDFNSDWSDYTAKDQHIATLMCASAPYYYIEIAAGIVSGQHPNTRSSTYTWEILFKEENGVFKCVTNFESLPDEIFETLDAAYNEIYPKGYEEALNAGRNATSFIAPNWYLRANHVLQGCLKTDLKYLWQDEDGNVYASIQVANGTSGNRSVYNIHVAVEDDTLGTVFDVTLGDTIIQMSGTSDLYTYIIPADQITSGTQTWTNMHSSVNNSND